MDNLPSWAVTIAAIAVGISPGLAILSAGSIAPLLYRVLGPRPKRAPGLGREPGREEPVGVAASQG